MDKFSWRIAIRRSLTGALLAALMYVYNELSHGNFDIEWRRVVSLALSGLVAGLIVDREIYTTWKQNREKK